LFGLGLRLFSTRALTRGSLLPAALLLAARLALRGRFRALGLASLLCTARGCLLFATRGLAFLFGACARLFSTRELPLLRAAGRGLLLSFASRWALVGGLAFALLRLPFALRFTRSRLLLAR
jgi:hypothetical protein